MTRRRWVRIGLAVALAVGGWFGWALTRQTDLQRVVARLDATDPGWQFADVRGGRLADQPPPAENVVFTAVAAAALIPKEFVAWRAAAEEAGTWPRVPSDRPPADPAGEAVWRATADPAGDAAWRAAAEAVAAARRCKDQPRGMAATVVSADPFMTLLPHVDGCHRTADLLRVDAVFAATHGDPAGAVDSLRAMASLARGVRRELFLISHLVGLAIDSLAADALHRTLAVVELPADGLAGVEADLHAAADPKRWATALRDWRAAAHLEMNAVAAGDVDLRTAIQLAGNGRRPPPSWVERSSYRLSSVGRDHAALLNQLTTLLDIARRPPHEWTAAVEALPLPPDDGRHPFARSDAVTARKRFAGLLRHLAVLRTAAVAAGCERFRLAHGRWPASLAELPPADVSDPYTGRPLLLKRLPDGLVVYSVGPDGTDDGGTLSHGVAPPPGADVGFRLWDVAARRQPLPR